MPAEALGLIAFLPLAFASVLVHELGHVLCGRLAGGVPTSFGMGLGRVFVAWSFGGTRFFLGARRFMSGIAFTLFPQLLPARWQQTLVLAGGILGNAVAGVLALAIFAHSRNSNWSLFWLLAAAINLCSAVLNGVPFQIRRGSAVFRSDGAAMLRAWLGRMDESPAELLRRADAVCALMREVGDLRGLRANAMHVADIWCDLGNSHHARKVLQEATEIAVVPLPPHQAYEKLVQASIESAEENTAAAEAIARAAREEFRGQNHQVGVFLADLVLAGVAERRGDSAQMALACDRLTANSIAMKRIRYYDSICPRLLAWRKAYLEGQGPEAVVAEYDALPARLHTCLAGLRLYRSVARNLVRIGQYEQAACAYDKALAAARALDESFRSSDREQFRIAQSALVSEAKTCLSELGRDEEVARLDNFFGPLEEMERRAEAEQALATQRRYGRILRFGLALTLLNLVAVFGLPLRFWLELQSRHNTDRAHADSQAKPPTGPLVLWLSVTLFTVVEVVVCVPLFVAGCWWPRLRNTNAVIVAWLSGFACFTGVTLFLCDHFFGP